MFLLAISSLTILLIPSFCIKVPSFIFFIFATIQLISVFLSCGFLRIVTTNMNGYSLRKLRLLQYKIEREAGAVEKKSDGIISYLCIREDRDCLERTCLKIDEF